MHGTETEPVEAASVGLHTKAVVVDRRTAFIGSPNIDPRSMIHNTEVAAVTESEALGKYLKTDAKDIRHVIENNTWDMAVSPAFKDTMAAIEAFLAEQGLIKTRVDWSTAYDWSALARLDKKLVP